MNIFSKIAGMPMREQLGFFIGNLNRLQVGLRGLPSFRGDKRKA
jgi:hypothetical protein